MGFHWQASCLCAASLTVQACAPGPASNVRPSSTPGLTIGISVQNEQYRFYSAMVEAMRQTVASQKYPYNLEVENARSSDEQLAQVEAFVGQGVDGIVLVPVDSQEAGPAILEANTANIPVFMADIRDQSGEENVAAIVTSNNKDGGKRAGAMLCNVSRGKTVLVLDQPGITSVQDRVSGFTNVISNCPHPSLGNINGGTTTETAAKALKSVLAEERNLGAVFAVNDTMALGALQAISEAKCHGNTSTGTIKVVGYDGGPDAIAAVQKGDLLAEIIQYPQNIGSLTIEQIHAYFAKKLAHPLQQLPTTVYRRGDPTPSPWPGASPTAIVADWHKCK